MTGNGIEEAQEEVQLSIDRLFTYAAWADKYDGAAHGAPIRGVALAMNEPVGTIGMICPDDYPLLGLISLIAPVLAMGNTCVVAIGTLPFLLPICIRFLKPLICQRVWSIW